MATARQRHEWAVGCSIIATIRNVNGGDNGRAVNPDEINPFRKTPADSPELTKARIEQARELWKARFG